MPIDYHQGVPFEQNISTEKVTRVEVIDYTTTEGGRAFVKWDQTMKVELQVQDDGRTLKIFLTKKENI